MTVFQDYVSPLCRDIALDRQEIEALLPYFAVQMVPPSHFQHGSSSLLLSIFEEFKLRTSVIANTTNSCPDMLPVENTVIKYLTDHYNIHLNLD